MISSDFFITAVCETNPFDIKLPYANYPGFGHNLKADIRKLKIHELVFRKKPDILTNKEMSNIDIFTSKTAPLQLLETSAFRDNYGKNKLSTNLIQMLYPDLYHQTVGVWSDTDAAMDVGGVRGIVAGEEKHLLLCHYTIPAWYDCWANVNGSSDVLQFMLTNEDNTPYILKEDENVYLKILVSNENDN